MTKILAAIVLYRMPARQSPAFCSLREIMRESAAAADAVRIAVFDNSPDFQESPDDFAGTYHRDPTNPGLAKPYNMALQVAADSGIPWLLLLDQDTTVTPGYIAEVLRTVDTVAKDSSIGVLAPKLVERQTVQSPHYPPSFLYAEPVDSSFYGLAQTEVHIFNSGSVLRVSALLAAGGFALEFPLDFLDHVTLHNLQAQGAKLFVLRAQLEHELSTNRPKISGKLAFTPREYNIHKAERAYYRLYGTPRQRLYFRLRYLRKLYTAAKTGSFHQIPYLLKLGLGSLKPN